MEKIKIIDLGSISCFLKDDLIKQILINNKNNKKLNNKEPRKLNKNIIF